MENYDASKIKDTLPNTLSGLLRLALDDMRKVKRSRKYRIDMNYWHNVSLSDRCLVCAAGAVMAASLNVPRNAELSISDFSPEIEAKLEAIDHLRLGQIMDAADSLHDRFNDNQRAALWDIEESNTVTPYAESPKRFYADCERLHRALKESNL